MNCDPAPALSAGEGGVELWMAACCRISASKLLGSYELQMPYRAFSECAGGVSRVLLPARRRATAIDGK